MTHGFKLSRRMARFRVPVAAALVLTIAGCNETDSFNPDSTPASQAVVPNTGSTMPPPQEQTLATRSSSMLASSTTSTESCLTQAGSLVTLRGTQQTFDDRKTAVSNLKIDASGATWTGIIGFPVRAGNGKANNLCWHGSTIAGPYTISTSWITYHSSAAMFMVGPGLKVEDATVGNYGDAVRIEDSTDNWTLRRFHVITARDDCVENDRLYGGLIDDALFEGCYVFMSERPGGGVNIPVSGAGKTVTIQNSLVYLKPMPTCYTGPAPCTGPLFKWSNYAGTPPTAVAITNTIFRVDQKPNHGDLSIPPGLGSCSNNTIVWLGAGTYPAQLPACFKVTTDKSVWDQAVAAWKARNT
jgi:hypothetical protein